eukprot:scaffold55481_cov32-Phaeocystis_antarctica.AAC.3
MDETSQLNGLFTPCIHPTVGLQRRDVSLLQLAHLSRPVAAGSAPLHPQRSADDGDPSVPAGGAGQRRRKEDARSALKECREAWAYAGRDRTEPRFVAESVHGHQAGAVLERQLEETSPLPQHEIGPVRSPAPRLRHASRPKRDGAAAVELCREHGARGIDHAKGQEDVAQP